MIPWNHTISYFYKDDKREATVGFHNGRWEWSAYLSDERHGSPVIIRWGNGTSPDPVTAMEEAEAWMVKWQAKPVHSASA